MPSIADQQDSHPAARHSPRFFIFGDPIVRRESSSGGFADDDIGIRRYRNETLQRTRGSIDSEAGLSDCVDRMEPHSLQSDATPHYHPRVDRRRPVNEQDRTDWNVWISRWCTGDIKITSPMSAPRSSIRPGANHLMNERRRGARRTRVKGACTDQRLSD